MSDTQLTEVVTDWSEKITRLRSVLDQVRLRLIDLESDLAELLAAINGFEFKLRSRVKPLVARLEGLEAEIATFLQQLRRSTPEDVENKWTAWSANEGGAAAAGAFRYREATAPMPPPKLDQDQKDDLKRLYRQLARRFHPDFAVNEAEREYRTQLMIAINSAYRAGDLERLEELALEPDPSGGIEYAQSEKELAEALSREIGRCQRRIDEILEELATLMNHESARLMKKAEQAAVAGRDFMEEIADQLWSKIHQKQVERDALEAEIESLAEGDGLHGDAFADAMWDISLDEAYEVDPESEISDWFLRRAGRYFSEDEDILDDSD